MDDVDIATDNIASFTDDALRKRRLYVQATRVLNVDGKCKECTLDVEPERLAANPYAELCADCAHEREEALKRRARTGR